MKYLRIPIRMNKVYTEDDLIQYGQNEEYSFLDIGQI